MDIKIQFLGRLWVSIGRERGGGDGGLPKMKKIVNRENVFLKCLGKDRQSIKTLLR